MPPGDFFCFSFLFESTFIPSSLVQKKTLTCDIYLKTVAWSNDL